MGGFAEKERKKKKKDSNCDVVNGNIPLKIVYKITNEYNCISKKKSGTLIYESFEPHIYFKTAQTKSANLLSVLGERSKVCA